MYFSFSLVSLAKSNGSICLALGFVVTSGPAVSSAATFLASVISVSKTSLVPAVPFLNTLPILFDSCEFIQPDKLSLTSGLKFLIWGINSNIVSLTKSSAEKPGGWFLGILL